MTPVPAPRRGEVEAPWRVAPGGAVDDGNFEGELSLSDLLSILRRRWLLVLALSVAGAGAGWFFHSRGGTSYVATSVIQIEDSGPTAVGDVGQILAGSSGLSDGLLSQLQLLQSINFLGSVVDAEGLRLQPLEGEGGPVDPSRAWVDGAAQSDTLRVTFAANSATITSQRTGQRASAPYGSPLALPGVTLTFDARPVDVASADFAVLLRANAIERLGRGLTSEVRPETNVVDVRFASVDSALSQRVVNRVAERFADLADQSFRNESLRRADFIEGQIAEAREELFVAQDQLTDFRRREGVVNSAQLGAAEQTGLMNVDMQLEQLRADRNVFRELLVELSANQATGVSDELQRLMSLPEVSGNPVFAQLYDQLRQLQTEREALTSGPWGLSDRNPTVIQLDQQITSRSSELVDALQSNLRNLDARFESLEELRNRTARRVASRPEAQAEEERLLAEVAAVRTRLEQLSEQLFLAQVQAAAARGPVQILDLAFGALPEQRAGLPVLLAVGVLLGLLSGSGLAVALEQLDTKVRRVEDLERGLDAPALGVIPQLQGVPGAGKRRRLGRRKSKKGDKPTDPGQELVTFLDARSSAAEAFRTLRTNLLYIGNGSPIRTVVVSSALPGEGKTTVASNLAVTFAQQGLRVLLIDADLRKPRISEVFAIDRKPGFSELLLGVSSLGEAIRPHPTIENLDLLPAGQLPRNPSELLGGERSRELLRTLRDSYDRVVIDTPPLAGGSDGAIIGTIADGVALVVRAGQTEEGAVLQARRQLNTVGARIVGGVLNDPTGEGERYGSYYAYYYKYDYYGSVS